MLPPQRRYTARYAYDTIRVGAWRSHNQGVLSLSSLVLQGATLAMHLQALRPRSSCSLLTYAHSGYLVVLCRSTAQPESTRNHARSGARRHYVLSTVQQRIAGSW